MNWARTLLLLISLITSKSYAQETLEAETTTLESNNVSNDVSSSSDGQVQLDSKLRNALLKALSELEGDENNEAQELENEEKTIERAQATAVTYFADDEQDKIGASQSDHQDEAKSLGNQTTIQETTENLSQNSDSKQNSLENPEDTLAEKISEVIVQKSNSVQSVPITAIEKGPVDFFKDAEQIITSASNSFINQNGDESISAHTPRSVKDDDEINTKISSFSKLNTITDFESKIPSKAVDESPFVKTYVRALGGIIKNDEANVNNDVVYVKSSNVGVNSKSSTTSEVKGVEAGNYDVKTGGNIESTTTAAPIEVSTEENEAKVEQVQFFSAPLVAAFTVHQDEKGQPKKVEPIFKNELNPKKEQNSVQPNLPRENTNLQSPTFNNLDLQKKQHILEQELEKLRNQQLLQQQSILSRNNVPNNQGFNNQVTSNQGLTQSGFNQAVQQNFNQFDPIFTEPDRSVVTKLASIDPNTLLSQNGGPILNRFTLNDAMVPVANPVKPSFINKIIPDLNPSLKHPNNKGEVSLIPSITFDPLIEAGKLPLNAQVLPNREPTGFLNFVPKTQNLAPNSQIQNSVASLSNTNLLQSNPTTLQQVSSSLLQPNSNFAQTNFNRFNTNSIAQPQQSFQNNPSVSQVNSNLVQPSSSLVQPNSNFAQTNFNTFNSNILAQPQQIPLRPNQNLAQPNQNFLPSSSNQIQPINNFVSSASQNKGQEFQNSNFLGNQAVQSGLSPIHSQSNNFLGTLNNDGRGPSLNQNNQFLTSNRILRQEQGILNPGLNQNSFSIIPSQQPFNPKHEVSYFPDNNRFLRPNQGVSLGQNTPNSNLGFQGVQGDFLNGNSLNQNRFFRSNLEGTVANPNFNLQQSVQQVGQQGFNNLGFSQSQIANNNRFLRSNQESLFLSNQNRFLSQPTVQNYRYSSSFGFPKIPLNKK